jgi:hypothetical protein
LIGHALNKLAARGKHFADQTTSSNDGLAVFLLLEGHHGAARQAMLDLMTSPD